MRSAPDLPWVLLITLLISPLLARAQQTSDDRSVEQFFGEIDEELPQLLRDFAVPGAAIAIIEDGEIAVQKGYGFADVEKRLEVNTKTGFNIGSISKTVAAWGVMKLVQEGKIDIDAPAETYLSRWHFPESEFDSDGVTVRRLLSHTAGLSVRSYPGWSPGDTLPTIEESLNGKSHGSGRVEIITEPGTRYSYSGGGFTVLQLIVEEVTGQRFEDYMQAQILDPLGMTNSSYKIDGRIMAASASEYDSFGEEIEFELFTGQAAAGLHTTIEDFTRFALASLYRSETHDQYASILPDNIIQQMMEPVPQASGPYGYGLGYTTRAIPGTSVVLRGHGGANDGWAATFSVNPETSDGFIMITNGSAGQSVSDRLFYDWVLWSTGSPLKGWRLARPPISIKLKSIIDGEATDDIAAIYKDLKMDHSEEYDFSEIELNNLGYHYMENDDLETAIVLLELNIAAFPDAFNVYDSYGEALLKQGDREKAVENYRKSVELNPGNENGIQVLNDLGVAAEDLARSMSIAVDAKVLAEYVGRYRMSEGDTVTIRANEGMLTAELEGRRINLIAKSAQRFRLLGDRSTVTFFTAATGREGLWTRGRIWGKLSDTPSGDSGSKGPADRPAMEGRPSGDYLVFRNSPSWGRPTDFEDVLDELGCDYDERESRVMEDFDLSAYGMIIIPGGQRGDYYDDYAGCVERFDDYVANGGILVLEMNGAEDASIVLPRGVTMASHGAVANAILEPEHPIFLPLSGERLIRANSASHGYLRDVPADAIILAVEADGEAALTDRPTFIEYAHGKGRVIAASQCFHDRDGSGRGPLMESVISYALAESWAMNN